MPENTKYVGRPTKWGNPFHINKLGVEVAVNMYRECLLNNSMCYFYFDGVEANIQYKRFKWMAENIETLKGFDLACFCPIVNNNLEYTLCHADVLIDIFNYRNKQE